VATKGIDFKSDDRSPIALAGFFKKLARADPMANFDHDEHTTSARRWQMARQLAQQLARKDAP